jgi:hypothetical protein
MDEFQERTSNIRQKMPILQTEKLMFKKLNALCLITASTICVAAGCQSGQKPETDASNSKAEITETEHLANTQAAAGARAECTLYTEDFDGPTLSTLGTSALDAILADSHSCNPLVLYIEASEDTPDRRQATARYLADRGGLKSDQIEFHSGTNPATNHLSFPDLHNYAKTGSDAGASTGQ